MRTLTKFEERVDSTKRKWGNCGGQLVFSFKEIATQVNPL
jgi:hypothetical protein